MEHKGMMYVCIYSSISVIKTLIIHELVFQFVHVTHPGVKHIGLVLPSGDSKHQPPME